MLRLRGASGRQSLGNGRAAADNHARSSSLGRLVIEGGVHATTRLELGSHRTTALARRTTGVGATSGLEGRGLVVVVAATVVAATATTASLETATVGAGAAVVTVVVVVAVSGRLAVHVAVRRLVGAAAVVGRRVANGQGVVAAGDEGVMLRVTL